VKNPPQAAGRVDREKKKGRHRKKRERAPLPGMTIHQDDRRHEWVEGQSQDLIVTMNEATSEHYDMRFVEEAFVFRLFFPASLDEPTVGMPVLPANRKNRLFRSAFPSSTNFRAGSGRRPAA
jgi:hypothetical protein